MNPLSRALLAGLAATLAAVLLVPPAGAAEPSGDYGAAPYLEKLWSQPTVREKQTQNWLTQAANLLENRGLVPLPDFYPTGESIDQTGAAADYSNYNSPQMNALIAATTTALRNLLQTAPWANDPQSRAFLAEVESLLQPATKDVKK